jgi:hypothetical protein
VELRIFTEPQMGATYADLLAVARRTEETGFDAFFRSGATPRAAPSVAICRCWTSPISTTSS